MSEFGRTPPSLPVSDFSRTPALLLRRPLRGESVGVAYAALVLTIVAIVLAVTVLPQPWGWIAVITAAVIDVAETAFFVWWSKQRRAAVGAETLVGLALAEALRTGRLDAFTGAIKTTEGKIELAQYNVKASGHVAKLRQDLGLAA